MCEGGIVRRLWLGRWGQDCLQLGDKPARVMLSEDLNEIHGTATDMLGQHAEQLGTTATEMLGQHVEELGTAGRSSSWCRATRSCSFSPGGPWRSYSACAASRSRCASSSWRLSAANARRAGVTDSLSGAINAHECSSCGKSGSCRANARSANCGEGRHYAQMLC